MTFAEGTPDVEFLAQYNDWYPMTNKWHSSQFLCTGVDSREPHYRFEKNRMVWKFELNKNAYRTGYYCETYDFMSFIDPRLMYKERDPDR